MNRTRYTQFLFVLATILPIAAKQVPAQQAPYTLHAVVTDSKGNPIPNLPQTAFTLQDNGVSVPLQSVHAGAAQSEKILLVIDAINTDYEQVAYEREQIQKFLTANEGVLAQPTAIAILADTSTTGTASFTKDGNRLNTVLQQQTIALRDLRRSAGFYGAEERLDLSLKALSRVLATSAATPGHTLILFISPGWPLLSGPGIDLTASQERRIYQQVEQVSAAIHAANATLYSINPRGSGGNLLQEAYYQQFVGGVRKPSRAQLGDLGLQVLAVQSGGLAIYGNNDIAATIARCVEDAKAPYTLTFIPPPSEPGSDYQRLNLRVADSNLKVRTAQGLYLAAPAAAQ